MRCCYRNSSWFPVIGRVMRKLRAPLRPCTDIDPAIVGVDDLADDREAQTRTLRFGGEERAEHLVHDFGRHTGAAVGDFHLDHRHGLDVAADSHFLFGGQLGGRNRHLPGAVHRFEGVGEQVGEDLAQLVWIALDPGQVAG